jgi:hypothetical protein
MTLSGLDIAIIGGALFVISALVRALVALTTAMRTALRLKTFAPCPGPNDSTCCLSEDPEQNRPAAIRRVAVAANGEWPKADCKRATAP